MRKLWSVVVVVAVGCSAPSGPATSEAPAPAPATEAPTPAPAPATPVVAEGASLGGRVAYPSEESPAMRVCAIDSTDPGTAVCVQTEANSPHWGLVVPAGSWWLVAWPLDTGTEGNPGLLTEASECLGTGGVDCEGHAPKALVVVDGDRLDGLDINDWFYDPREFPPPMPPKDAAP
jgi:hypothetical protein